MLWSGILPFSAPVVLFMFVIIVCMHVACGNVCPINGYRVAVFAIMCLCCVAMVAKFLCFVCLLHLTLFVKYM